VATGTSDRLSAADASNIVLDAHDQVNAFLMAGLLAPGGFVSAEGVADVDRLRAHVAERLARAGSLGLRRLVQRVRADGRDLVWEACSPDLTRQVRMVEEVAGEQGLAELCAGLMTTPMPIDRPLWEVLVVPGASTPAPGVVVRFHHAVSDGIGAVALLEQLFGREGTSPPPRPAQRSPRPRRSLRAVLKSARRVAAVLQASVPRTVLLGPISGHRGVAFLDVDLIALSGGARRVGGTVNDALLAAVTWAVEDSLRAAGQPVPATIPASVPVALPDRGGSGNAVGIMRVELPSGVEEPSVRLERIASLTRTAKSEARSQGTFELTRSRLGSRLFAWLARRQRLVALFVTNVRGPQEPMSLAGAPLVKAWPLTPIQGNVRLGVSALSYAGRLGCAVHVDADALPAELLARSMSDQLGRIAR
jgi:diacylglycerol O-acyltransferase / wax synthase